jgi:hypothetical protein
MRVDPRGSRTRSRSVVTDQLWVLRHVVRPLLELHDVFELVFDDVLPAAAGAAVAVSRAIEARRKGFMASSLLNYLAKIHGLPSAFLSEPAPRSHRDVEPWMNMLEAEGKLKTFHETMLGTSIQVFGKVAVALGACEMLENGEDVTRDVGAFLFVNDGGEWRIAGQAWDLETEDNPIPAHLRKPEA